MPALDRITEGSELDLSTKASTGQRHRKPGPDARLRLGLAASTLQAPGEATAEDVAHEGGSP